MMGLPSSVFIWNNYGKSPEKALAEEEGCLNGAIAAGKKTKTRQNQVSEKCFIHINLK